jgi:hemerythrin-like metal-binding protein
MTEDNRIEWTSNLSVNNEIIDSQHRKIFNIMNQLRMADPDTSMNSEFARILSTLTDYGLSHLKEEEEFMAKHSFPGLEEHKKAHKAYLYKVAMFNLNFQKTSHTEVIEFLKNWWMNHIAKMDMQYRDFIYGKKH